MTQQTTDERPGIAAAIVVHEGRVLMVRRRVSEGQEETGLIVEAVKLLGERVHPKTGRLMSYTACRILGGTAHVADTEELAELAWVAHGDIPEYVPYGLFEPVQDYLDGALSS